MPRIKLVLEYDGGRFAGWQVQPNAPTIQGELEKAAAALLHARVSVAGASRTDSGVHARGQVAAFDSPLELPTKAYVKGLNSLLPEDIAVLDAQVVDAAFDPRRHSTGKRYVYSVCNLPERSPLRRRTHWAVFAPLDVAGMRGAAEALLGTHDFSAFRAADCEASHAVRTLTRLDVDGQPGQEVRFTVEGPAFLKHMVRNLVGTLVEVGRGRYLPEWVSEVLASKDRTQAGPTAPAHGLTLEEVRYAAPGDDGD